MLGIDAHLLPSPERTAVLVLAGDVIILIHGAPSLSRAARGEAAQHDIVLIEHAVPLVVGQLVGTLHGLHHVVVLIEHRALQLVGELLAQGVGAEPGLDRRAAKRVDDDALRHARLLEHLAAQEVAHCREQPRIILGHGFPVDGRRLHVALRPTGVRVGLHAEHAYLRVLVVVDDLTILRVDALDGHVDVRLARAEPHIANETVVDGLVVDHELERPACLLLGQHHLPRAVVAGHRLIHFLSERHTDTFARIGCAPYGYGHATLQHHAVLEHLWQLHLGTRHHCAEERKCKNK